MDYYGQKLIEYLNNYENKRYRIQLYDRLNADKNNIFVYYFVPLSNLISIVNSSGIKCRNNLTISIDDLSGQNVQSKRMKIDKKLTLAAKENRHIDVKKDVHQCINLFLNPINYTFIAFQRKALFNSFIKGNPLDKPICILEFPMESFFNDNTIKWGISEKNLASDYFTSFSEKLFSKYEWSKIFNYQLNKNQNTYQSAEFVVFKGNQLNSNEIPFSIINRIIVHENDIDIFKKKLPQFNDIYQINSLLFSDNSYLLFPGKKLLEQIINFNNSGIIPINKFINILAEFKNICSNFDFYLTPDKFSSDFMAYSYHGISHTTRVLFWVHLLNKINNVGSNISICSIYSALIHDLGKERNVEDENHGINSANKHMEFLSERIKDKDCINSCINAIKYHSFDDNKCQSEIKDIVWKTLKDADALDRGRFGQPNPKSGCNEKYFRLKILKNNAVVRNQFMWFGYELATITRYTYWNKDTCIDLINSISDWVLTYANYCYTSSIENEFVEKLKEI